MPQYDFKCERCSRVVTRIYPSFKAMCLEPVVRCDADGSRMERQVSAPAFAVSGFNAANGYAGKQSCE